VPYSFTLLGILNSLPGTFMCNSSHKLTFSALKTYQYINKSTLFQHFCTITYWIGASSSHTSQRTILYQPCLFSSLLFSIIPISWSLLRENKELDGNHAIARCEDEIFHIPSLELKNVCFVFLPVHKLSVHPLLEVALTNNLIPCS
jgi:hypothetical protein